MITCCFVPRLLRTQSGPQDDISRQQRKEEGQQTAHLGRMQCVQEKGVSLRDKCAGYRMEFAPHLFLTVQWVGVYSVAAPSRSLCSCK